MKLTYPASVTLAYDAANYEQPAISDLNWTFGKASYDMTGAGWDYPDPFVFDGTEKIVEVTGLPDGVTAFYSGNTATAIGNYIASVTLSYDAEHYVQPVIPNLKIGCSAGEVSLYQGSRSE